MGLNVLSPSQVEQFIECGYTRLEEAYPSEKALAVQDFLWEQLAVRGIRRDDQATWTQPMVHIKESYEAPVFQECATQRLFQAVEDLVGQGRHAHRTPTRWGWWPVNFALGADRPWDVPTGGWHWDGITFKHHVDSPEQGLLLICIFSEIKPHGGSTVVAEGSHKLVARFLNQYPDGLDINDAIKLCASSHPWLAELTGRTTEQATRRIPYFMDSTYQDQGANLRVVETPGSPGDVYLCHPFIFHAASQNHSGVPRFICNRAGSLKERMRLQGSSEDCSPLENSVRQAIALTT